MIFPPCLRWRGEVERTISPELAEWIDSHEAERRDDTRWVAERTSPMIVSEVEGVSFRQRYIPAGEFWMGSKDSADWSGERSRHKVQISKPFLIGQTQVTQAQWEAIMGNNPMR